MNQSKFFLAIIALLFLYTSCATDSSNSTQNSTSSTSSTASNAQTSIDATDFNSVFKTAYDALASKNLQQLNLVINKDLGVYKFYNPGAMVAVVYTQKIEDDFLSFPFESSNQVLKVEKLPNYDCDKGWDKEGNFVEEVQKFKQISKFVAMQEGITGVKPTKNELEKAKKSEELIQKVVQDTKNHVRLYFGQIEGKWYLLLVDAVTPCDA